MADRVIKVSLAMQVNNFVNGAHEAARAAEKAKKSSEDAVAAYEKQSQAMSQVGRGLLAAGAVAVAATALAVNAAIGWESAWAGVLKTVDGTPVQLARVEQGLRDLTGVLPASHDEIAAVAEAAGQLGIQTDNVVAFTRTMIDLGETTNLSANDAATALARFTNIMGTSQTAVSNLGSALVGLGNNYATTEREILEMSMRLAGAGKQIGMSEGDVLGLATALSSVGIEAEAGGSAMSKVMIDIASSVEQGGERLEQFASISGMSAKEFATQWRTEPGKALAAFVTGLAAAEAQGSSTLGVLAELGVTEVRMRDALLRSSSAADMFAGAMARGNAEFEANNALTEEAAKRYATVESQLGIMRNKINDAAIDFGAVFLPAVSAVAKAVGGLADLFGVLPEGAQAVVAVGVALAGAAALAGGAFLLAVPKIVEFKIALATLSTSSIPAVAGAAASAQAAVGRMAGGMSAAARFLAGPWGLALAAAAVGVHTLNKALDHLKASSAEMQNSLRTASGDAILETARSSKFTLLDGIISDSKEQLAELDKTLAELEKYSKGVDFGGLGGTGGYGFIENLFRFATGANAALAGPADALKRIGAELAALAAADAPAAYVAFQRLAAETDGSEASLRRLLDSTGPFKEVLIEQASVLGLNVMEMSEAERIQALLNIVMGDAEGAGDAAADGAKSAADAYRETADRAKALTDEVLALVGAFDESNGRAQNAESANARYRASLEGISDQVARQRDEYERANNALDGFIASLDRNTAAGSGNRAMFADLARDAKAAAEAQLEVELAAGLGEQAALNYSTTLAAQREALINAGEAAGFSRDEVATLADEIFKLPSEREVRVLVEQSEAMSKLQQFKDRLNSIPNYKGVTVDTILGNPSMGGHMIPGRASGGILPGAPSAEDNMLIHAASGEFIVKAQQTAIPANRAALEYINNGGVIRGFANGGEVQPRYVTWTSPRQTTPADNGITSGFARVEEHIHVNVDGRQVAEAIRVQDRSVG